MRAGHATRWKILKVQSNPGTLCAGESRREQLPLFDELCRRERATRMRVIGEASPKNCVSQRQTMLNFNDPRDRYDCCRWMLLGKTPKMTRDVRNPGR